MQLTSHDFIFIAGIDERMTLRFYLFLEFGLVYL